MAIPYERKIRSWPNRQEIQHHGSNSISDKIQVLKTDNVNEYLEKILGD